MAQACRVAGVGGCPQGQQWESSVVPTETSLLGVPSTFLCMWEAHGGSDWLRTQRSGWLAPAQGANLPQGGALTPAGGGGLWGDRTRPEKPAHPAAKGLCAPLADGPIPVVSKD